MQYISSGQVAWRNGFDAKYRFGIPLDHINRPDVITVKGTGGNTMRTMKLPARNTAASFDDAEVADIRLTLLNPDLPAGEGVVVSDGLDTAAKARVRTRNVAKLLSEPQTIGEGDIPAEFWQGDDEDALPALFIQDYANDAAEDEEQTYTLPAVNVRSHTVEQGGEHFPLVSLKK